MSHESLHEPAEKLSPATIDRHRATVSLMEEMEAVDWYRQRADDCDDQALKAILLHNMREEMEHAAMVIEWLRRANTDFDKQLREILLHNMREEMEHASMVLEWIRRHNSDFAGHLKTYLFTDGPITGIEKVVEQGGGDGGGGSSGGDAPGSRTTVGSLKGRR